MKTVFVLQHLHELPDGEEDVKMIGVYRTREAGLAAIDRLKTQPGFCDLPALADNDRPGTAEGFHLDEYVMDQDNWTEGYITL